MIKTQVTPASKVKSAPHPKVGGTYAPQAYNNPKEKGEDIVFIPKK